VGCDVTSVESELIDEAWAAVTGQPEVALDRPTLTADSQSLPSRVRAADAGVACIAVALAAAVRLQQQLTGSRPPTSLDRRHAALALRSERFFAVGTQPAGMGFAPLSRFWRTADGWVRTHANYPWHRDALLTVLRAPNEHDAVAAAIAERSSEELEEAVFAAGGIAAAVRSVEEWRDHPQGQAVHVEPLVSHRSEPAPQRSRDGRRDDPMSGVRVLDLTRVIAGPVCTRFLGALGADVLRVDPPGRPDIGAGEPADTLLGKRSSMLDVATQDGSATLHALLDAADVVVSGYRPGALDRFGLSEAALLERNRGLVIVILDAWGHTGPWRARRGFDSVVQAATGIALAESDDGVTPGALPCQLLDHGTGYLAAAAVLDGLRRQQDEGGSHVRRLSLARTAAWLTSRSKTPEAPPALIDDDPGPWLQTFSEPEGVVTAIRPPGRLGDRPLTWPVPVARYGRDKPMWATP
jgi:hypothetical protein